MHYRTVASSSMGAVAYDAERATLALRFHNGAEYHYFMVPQQLYEGLVAAPSKGAYFHDHIRDAGYRFIKIS